MNQMQFSWFISCTWAVCLGQSISSLSATSSASPTLNFICFFFLIHWVHSVLPMHSYGQLYICFYCIRTRATRQRAHPQWRPMVSLSRSGRCQGLLATGGTAGVPPCSFWGLANPISCGPSSMLTGLTAGPHCSFLFSPSRMHSTCT